MDAPDVPLQLVVPPSASGTPARVGKARGMLIIRGGGDRQFPVDRLNPQLLSMRVDERPFDTLRAGFVIARGGRAPPSRNMPMPF